MKSTLTKRGLHVKSSGYKVTFLVLFVLSYFHVRSWSNKITSRALSFCLVLPGCQNTVKVVIFSVFYGCDLISYWTAAFYCTQCCNTGSTPFFGSESGFVLCLCLMYIDECYIFEVHPPASHFVLHK